MSADKMKFEPTRRIYLKPYTLTELAGLYNVNYKTLREWIKPFEAEIGKKIGRFYTIPQVRIIFEKLELPTMSVLKTDDDQSETG